MTAILRKMQRRFDQFQKWSFSVPSLVFSTCTDEDDFDSGQFTQANSNELFPPDSSKEKSDAKCYQLSKSDYHLFALLFALVTLVKILLFPSYVSTDFDVHQHWLWITYNLPISKWYQDASSQWTLDYPPLFAWFEFILARLVAPFSPELVQQHSTPLRTLNVVFVHRATVVLSDLVFAFSAFKYMHWWFKSQIKRSLFVRDELFAPTLALSFLLLWSPALLLLDHIHFQYNGMLTGLLLLSIYFIVTNQPIRASITFAILLNMKHLYLYVAPAFFVYLLRTYCFSSTSFGIFAKRINSLAVCVISVFFVSFAPFIYHKQIVQVLSRLFPFQRGLSHAYWAPNVWAIYNTIDRFACRLLSSTCSSNRTTGGLVQEFQHHVLPTITPLTCAILTVLSILPILIKLWRHTSQQMFVRACILCAYGSFLFGWHVHEKAIVMVILPILPFAFSSIKLARLVLMITIPATFAQFPLFTQPAETPIKVLLLLTYALYANMALKHFYRKTHLLSSIESLYLIGLVGIQCLTTFGDLLLFNFNSRMPFLHLLLTSLYTSFAVIYTWLAFYVDSLQL